MTTSRVPEMVPLLSRGKHRNPRKGACFMELASFVAGERWSDHPSCTHPLLASLARLINDCTTDAGRHRLATLVPSVIGLTSDDRRVDIRIALRAATTAVPVAAAERQRAMAVAVLVGSRLLDDLGDPMAHDLQERGRAALAEAPEAAQWAEEFARRSSTTVTGFQRHGAPNVVRQAVDGIARACVRDPDGMLHDLLVATIDDCAAVIHGGTSTQPGVEVVSRSWPLLPAGERKPERESPRRRARSR